MLVKQVLEKFANLVRLWQLPVFESSSHHNSEPRRDIAAGTVVGNGAISRVVAEGDLAWVGKGDRGSNNQNHRV